MHASKMSSTTKKECPNKSAGFRYRQNRHLSRMIFKQVKAQHNFCLYQANQAFASVNYSIFSAHTVAMKVSVPNFFLFDALISRSPINHGYALIYLYLWQEAREVGNSWFTESVVHFCREGGRLEIH